MNFDKILLRYLNSFPLLVAARNAAENYKAARLFPNESTVKEYLGLGTRKKNVG